jgi:peptidoglycan glycosyltransferase
MIASAVANEGILMRPYLVDRIVDGDGDAVSQNRAKMLKRVMAKKEADVLKEMMRSVAVEGTAYDLASLSIKVAGKTGSAEYDNKGNSHAWFVGFAPYDEPQIAISIIVENGGTSSSTAVPIAKKIFSNYLE